jgi:hypothetical protein
LHITAEDSEGYQWLTELPLTKTINCPLLKLVIIVEEGNSDASLPRMTRCSGDVKDAILAADIMLDIVWKDLNEHPFSR